MSSAIFQEIINQLAAEAQKDLFAVDMNVVWGLLEQLGKEAYKHYINPNLPAEKQNPLEDFLCDPANQALIINNFQAVVYLNIAVNAAFENLYSDLSAAVATNADVIWATLPIELCRFGAVIVQRLIYEHPLADEITLDYAITDPLRKQFDPVLAKNLNNTYDLYAEDTEKQRDFLINLCQQYKKQVLAQLPKMLRSDFDQMTSSAEKYERYKPLITHAQQLDFFIEVLSSDSVDHIHKLNIVLGEVNAEQTQAEHLAATKIFGVSSKVQEPTGFHASSTYEYSSFKYGHAQPRANTPSTQTKELSFLQMLRNLKNIITKFLAGSSMEHNYMDKFRADAKQVLDHPEDLHVHESAH
jgi:hypothetical protein